MKTVVHSNDLAVSKALKQFIKKQVSQSMNICSDNVERIVIRLKDINGPKGGRDQECCVEVKLPNLAPVIVTKRSSNIYKSISNALGRASRTTLRRISKRRAILTSINQTDLTSDVTNDVAFQAM